MESIEPHDPCHHSWLSEQELLSCRVGMSNLLSTEAQGPGAVDVCPWPVLKHTLISKFIIQLELAGEGFQE